MRTFTTLLALLVAPLHAPAAVAPSILEAAEFAAASGIYRAQNTSTITTGRIRPGDKKRSAIAYALSGALAFAGAGLWRWLPCRNVSPGDATAASSIDQFAYYNCFDADGMRRGLDTPTKWMVGAGVGLEAVSLVYLISHLTSDGDGS